jgi:2-methylaconitate cis-trans-isomerase PrpF
MAFLPFMTVGSNRHFLLLSRKFTSGNPLAGIGRRLITTAFRKCNHDRLDIHYLLLQKSLRRNASSLRVATDAAVSTRYYIVSDTFGYSVDDIILSRRTTTTAEFLASKADMTPNGFVRRRRNKKTAIPFVIQRGGTSKGVFFRKEDLPECPELRDMVIKDAFGSPDIRQIDGLGGADVLTSKVAIVSRRRNVCDSDTANNDQNIDTGTNEIVADVDYLFGQVEFGGNASTCGNNHTSDIDNRNDENDIDIAPTGILYDVNCGNISAGVGPYAIEEGLIEVNDDTVTPIQVDADGKGGETRLKYCQKVSIYNVNTGKIIVAEVPVEKVVVKNDEDGDGDEDNDMTMDAYWTVVEDGDYEIDGVPGTSAYLPLDFSQCIGTLGNRKDGVSDGVAKQSQESSLLLPTGNTRDTVVIDEHLYDVSLLDVANFVVHIDGRQLGLTGKEASMEILNNEEFWNKVRKIRYEAAKLVMKEDEITLTKPFTSVVFPFLRDHGYESIRGDFIYDEEKQEIRISKSILSIDFRSFVLFCDHPHKAYPGTASIATAAAALIDGTVVNDVMNKPIETTVGKANKRCREKIVTIGHPSGRMSVSSQIEETSKTEGIISPDRETSVDDAVAKNEFSLQRSVIGRTSRRIADGFLYLKAQTARRLSDNR